MQETAIAWTDETWNPVHGCSKVSAGCDHCYAERISRQYNHTEHPWTNEYAEENVSLRPDKLGEPATIDEGTRIFVNSMSDLFHSQVPDEFIERVLDVARETPRHVYQILTKRPGRAAHMDVEWPENVWLGTSVEDDRVVERIDLLRKADAATLFVSFEPLIAPVGDYTEPGIVLDPFAGAGTTALVAKNLGRRFVGIELNPDYVAMAQRRVGVTVDEPDRLLEDGETSLAAFADGGDRA